MSLANSCSKSDDMISTVDIDCSGSKYNGHSLMLGPKGGCYYINSNNNKTYVDRSYCHC